MDMTTPESDLNALLRTLQPILYEGPYVFSVLREEVGLNSIPAITTTHEEGTPKSALSVTQRRSRS
jgi:hypothetical protein